jgi:gas vesicle protein
VGEEPDRIRAEIEQTRAEMSETVDALGYKADVKTRAKENIQDKRDAAKESIMGVKDKIVGAGDSVTSGVSDRTPDAAEVKAKARRGASVAQENPLGLAIGSVAVGFIAGMLLPATRVEDERLGEMSDSVIEKAKETGQEALEHGKQVAQETVESAQETMKESGQEHAQQVKESAQESASSGSSSQPTYTTH